MALAGSLPSVLSGASIIFFFFSIASLPLTCSSLSTVSISHTSNYTIICALIPSSNSLSYLNCTSSPNWVSIPISLPGIPLLAVAGGEGFVCAHTLPGISSSNASIRCWRFTNDGTVLAFRRGRDGTDLTSKRIYSGPALDELAAGATHLCGVVTGTSRLQCWQWPTFDVPDLLNLSRIAVGGDFVCGLSRNGNVQCLGLDREIIAISPRGNYSAVAAGLPHACSISLNGMLQCWGPGGRSPPSGEFQALASGGNRSCALRLNGTAVCWAEDFRLPEGLRRDEFVAILGQGGVFCGVFAYNYSLVCWGSKILASDNNNSYYRVFDRVLPGTCRITACPCSSLPDSESLCSAGAICMPCPPVKEPLQPTTTSGSGRRRLSRANLAFLVVGAVGSTVALVIAAYFLILRFCLGKSCSRVHDSGRLEGEAPPAGSTRSRYGTLGPLERLEEFPLHVLAEVTGGFSEDHLVGSGGFGSVYRARLPDGRDVAIKRAESGSRQEKDHAFVSELAQLSRVNHKNLVQLLGFCDEEPERVLVYEFMANGTLHEHLHKLEWSPLMEWTPRMKVALDAARGIEYLHTYAVPPVIHRDIKSSNILLNEEWTAKVADFGLSLKGPGEDEERSHLSMRAAGTIGYIDPEYFRRQVLTSKSDVYSFGVLLLELLTGRKAIHRIDADGGGPPRNVVDYAIPYIVSDNIHRVLDPRVPPPTPYEIEAVAYVGYLAADCVRLEGLQRPSMPEIVAGLERALAVCLAVPPISPSSMSVSSP
ncbi:serine/threonine-protein kinase-like protein CCR4 [Aristolochia californica]|uniref:serine/threonine-protein kinase-like protein CCR4 n=1 Tax=Aristolochia californica TaxID=171875 RepID=UPI0035DF13F9